MTSVEEPLRLLSCQTHRAMEGFFLTLDCRGRVARSSMIATVGGYHTATGREGKPRKAGVELNFNFLAT